MYTVFLAGGTASGKSSAARELERLGAWRIDLDELSRAVLAPGEPCVAEVCAAFGDDLVDPQTGELDRALLARRAFAEEHEQAIAEFVISQAASVETVNDDPEAAAPLVVEAGIIDAEPVAEKAIPACHLVCLTGTEMQEALSGYLQVLYDADTTSVGGALPEDEFYMAFEG